MFDVFTNLKCVTRLADRPAWLWSVEFRAVDGTHWGLTHMSEGIAPTLETAQVEMISAAARGKEQLRAAGFKIKDTTF